MRSNARTGAFGSFAETFDFGFVEPLAIGDKLFILILICKGLFKVSFQPKTIIARDHVLSTPTTENKVSRFLQDRK